MLYAFAKIPKFDEAYDRWMTWAKSSSLKEQISAGEDYVEIFEDLEELNEKLEKARAKDSKITSPSKRAKAEERTKASHLKKLAALADKLQKLADKYGDGTYYGRAASDSYHAFQASSGQTLTDKRER